MSRYLILTVDFIDYGDKMPRFEGINMGKGDDPAERDTGTCTTLPPNSKTTRTFLLTIFPDTGN